MIDTLKPKPTRGIDNISNQLLKHIKHEISDPISRIINQSFLTGVFPNKLKIARVIPVHKKNDDQLFENYRPISILPSISKIFEKIMHGQIYDHFTENDFLYANQYGFRKEHNTEFAAMELVDRIASKMENRDIPINIYLDMSKAFDTLDHDILLSKLEYYGIQNKALDLMQSYLADRYQYVAINNEMSNFLPIHTGVPQGSILGPLLFIIYINDFCKASDLFHSIIYADDVTLTTTLTGARLIDVEKSVDANINHELENIGNWLKLNKLSINCTKTKAMAFHTPQRKIECPAIRMENKNIQYVKQFNFLGIIFDSNLQWKHHAKHVSIRLSKTLGILNKLKNVLPLSTLIQIYDSLFLSHIQYGLFIWGWHASYIGKLVKKAVRIITKSKYNAHTSMLFKKLGLLKFDDLCSLHDSKMCFKHLNLLVPNYLTSSLALEFSSTRYAIRSYNSNSYNLPHIKHSFAKQMLSYRIPNILNKMPDSVRNKITSHSFIGFKLYIKANFINNYQTECSIQNCFVCGQ